MSELRVQIRLVHPEHYTNEGQTMHLDASLLEWRDIELQPEGECGHGESMCLGCIANWWNDWEILINGQPFEEFVEELRDL